MDGSCIVQIIPSRQLNALANTIHTNVQTDKNITYTHTHTKMHTHTMIHLDLWKCLLKTESFELDFEVRKGGEILQAGRQRIPDSWGNETERTVTNRFETAFRDFLKVSYSMIGRGVKSDTCREELKGKRDVYHQNDGKQELQSCMRRGISQAANGVHSAVVLNGLAFVSSE